MITPDQRDNEVVKRDNLPENERITVAVQEGMSATVVGDYIREVYSNTEGTVVRETVSNAVDIHRTEDVDRDVEVGIDESGMLEAGQSEFYVRDFGSGMSEEFIANRFFKMRDSTKNDRNKTESGEDLIGGWGIGGQSPYGYADTWILISYYNGTKTTYLCQRDGKGGWAQPIDREDTDRTNGITVRVPLQPGDVAVFEREIVEQLRFLLDEIEIQADGLDVELPETIVEGEGIVLYDDEVKYDYSGSSYQKSAFGGVTVVMGGIPYDLDVGEVPDMDSYYRGNPIAIFVGSGEVDLNLSREHLEYNDRTKEALSGFAKPLQEAGAKKFDGWDETGDVISDHAKRWTVKHGRYSSSFVSKVDQRYKDYRKAVKGLYNEGQNMKSSGFRRGLNAREIESVRYGNQSHATEDTGKRTVIKKLAKTQGREEPPVYYLREGEDIITVYNRYLADKHGTAYVFSLAGIGSGELEEAIKDSFSAYRDLDFDQSKYKSSVSRPEGQIPAYKPKLSSYDKNWTPNDEQIRDILDYPEQYAWGYKDQYQRLRDVKIGSQATHHLPMAPENDRRSLKAIRVSKANARDLPEERKVENVLPEVEGRAERIAQYWKTHKLAKEVSLLSRLSYLRYDIEGADNLYHMHRAIKLAAQPYKNGKNVSRFVRMQDVELEDVDYIECISHLVHRAQNWASKLKPIKRAIRRQKDGAEYFLRPRIKNISAPNLTPVVEFGQAEMSAGPLDNRFLQ